MEHPSQFGTTLMVDEDKLQKYRAVFDSLDTDGSGNLSREEIHQALLALGKDPTNVQDILGEHLDAMLSFEDFVGIMERTDDFFGLDASDSGSDSDSPPSDIARLQTLDVELVQLYHKLFTELDVKQLEKLTAEDLQNHMRNLSLRGATLSPEELNFFFALVEAADSSPTKALDIEGFALVAQDHDSFMDQYRRRGNQNNNFFHSSVLSAGNTNTRASSSGRPDLRRGLSANTLARIPDLDKYRAVFDEFDQDNKGRVTDKDVTAMMNRLGRVPTEDESSFLFELLQMVGDNGFTFEEFVLLMQEDADTLAHLGRSVSTWKSRQSHKQRVNSMRLMRANISRIGLKHAIEREELRLQKEEHATLERINKTLSSDKLGRASRTSSRGGGGFQFTRIPSAALMFSNDPPPPTSAPPPPPSHTASRSQATHKPAGLDSVFEPSALLTPLEMLRYQAVFNALDADMDGMVSVAEMLRTTRGVTGRQPSEDEVREFIQMSDLNGSGTMEFEEFVVVMQRTKRLLRRNNNDFSPELEEAANRRKMDKYRIVFDTFDTNKDGKVTSEELRNQLLAMGKRLDEGACRHMMNTFDTNKNGSLEFEEFVHLLDNLVAKEFAL